MAYITKGQKDGKTIVGFGGLEEYKGNKPTVRDFFYKANEINAVLKAVEADKIPVTVAGSFNGEKAYLKVNNYLDQGVSKNGHKYSFIKMAIELKPEVKDEAGNVTQKAERIYATKGKEGYALDEGNPKELTDKLAAVVAGGVQFTLSATNPETLKNYQKLEGLLNQVDKSAIVDLDFKKGEGVSIKSVTSPAPKGAEKLEPAPEARQVDANEQGVKVDGPSF